MTVEELKHHVIEQAKELYRGETCTDTFEHCLSTAASNLVRPPFSWWVGERNGVWALDVWIDGTDYAATGDAV